MLGLNRFVGRKLVISLLYTGLCFLPVVIGLLVYILLSRSGPLGQLGSPLIPALFNPYGVIAVNPAMGVHIRAELADQFIDWLVSVPTQELIGEYGVAEFGDPLFVPDSEPWHASERGR